MNIKIKILMIGPFDKTGGVANHTVHLANALRNTEADIVLYNSSFEEDLPSLLVNILKIYRRTLGLLCFLLRNRSTFDILHVQSSGWLAGFIDALTCTFCISALNGKKFIVTFHHSNTKEFLEAHERIMGLVLKSTNKFIVVSHQQEKALKNAFPNASNIKVIPNGYDPYLFRFLDKSLSRKRLNLPQKAKIILNIANLEEYKGQKYLIQSMKNVLASDNDAMLCIVGKGSLLKELQLLIDNSLCKENILLAGGNKPREEIPIWMNACDVFVLPSLSEGNPTVMFEALGCGKPFVGTNVGGIPEIIINDKLGILVEPRDANGLAEAISTALHSKWDAEYIRDYARKFTWDRIAEELLNVYEKILKEN